MEKLSLREAQLLAWAGRLGSVGAGNKLHPGLLLPCEGDHCPRQNPTEHKGHDASHGPL